MYYVFSYLNDNKIVNLPNGGDFYGFKTTYSSWANNRITRISKDTFRNAQIGFSL